MSTAGSDANNPYQSPASIARAMGPPLTVSSAALVKLVKDFRSQIHALGAFWIIIGSVVIGLGAFASSIMLTQTDERPAAIFAVVFVVLGAIWVALGIMSCLKQMWAVYVGLVLSYLSVIGNVINLNICGIVILVVVIFQAHRVIGWARQLASAGIPLTARPDQLALESQKTIDPSQWQAV
jgi:hypothetical protein